MRVCLHKHFGLAQGDTSDVNIAMPPTPLVFDLTEQSQSTHWNKTQMKQNQKVNSSC